MTLDDEVLFDCVIVGAGICGLLAAQQLQLNGLRVAVVEKSRGVGGRMATRRFSGLNGQQAIFDHGAQYMTHATLELRALIQSWTKKGILAPWQNWHPPAPKERFISREGMTQVPKFLAKNLTIFQDCRIEQIERALHQKQQTFWQLKDSQNRDYWGKSVLMTAPVPQAMVLLQGILQDRTLEEALKKLTYSPCLSLMASLSEPSQISAPGGILFRKDSENTPLGWIADNQQKGISPVPAVTLQANGRWSEAHFEAEEAWITKQILTAAKPWISEESVLSTQLMRWRYSSPNVSYPKPYAEVSTEPPLLLAGDCFGGPKVEGAVLSGLAAANQLLKFLTADSLQQASPTQ